MNKYTVNRDDNIYEAWPDIVLTEKGKLICVFSECEHHGNRDNARIMLTESLDKGRTWSEKKPLTEITYKSDYYNCARISKLSDGRLAVLCDRIKRCEGQLEGRSSRVYMWLSDDDGCSWQGPFETPADGIVPDKLKELKSGRLIIASHKHNPETGKLEQYMWYSDDKGSSWSPRIIIGADSRYNLCAVSIVEVQPNTLVALMRENSMTGIDCMKSISYDGGETWDGVYRMPIPACHRPVADFLNDGRILVTYRFLQGGKGWLGSLTQNTFGAFMSAEDILQTAREQQSARIFPIDHDRSPIADTGYTGWVQFDNDEIYVVNYIVDDAPKAQIRGYSFMPGEFLL